MALEAKLSQLSLGASALPVPADIEVKGQDGVELVLPATDVQGGNQVFEGQTFQPVAASTASTDLQSTTLSLNLIGEDPSYW